ncbi:MAG: hypothetical protein AB7R90_06045 [Reyranellaceae bacterium]
MKLAVALGVLGFGFLLLAAIAVERPWRWGLAAMTGGITAIMVDIHFERTDWLLFARDIAIGAVGAVAVFALLLGVKYLVGRTKFRGDIEVLRLLVVGHAYEHPDSQPPAPSDRDLARRWFVVIAAALGSVVASLMAYGEFWQEMLNSLRPAKVLAAGLVVAVAVVLVGPVQEFVIGRSLIGAGAREAPGESFATFFTGRRSLRSVLRLLLVFALALTLLELINNSLDQAIVSAGSRASFTIILASIAPAMVTAYWCVALQRGLPKSRLAKASMWASITCFAIVLYVPSFAMAVLLAIHEMNSPKLDTKALFAVVASPLIGGFIAVAIGFMAAGVYALLGGFVLARLNGWLAMAALLVALLVAAAINQVGVVVYILMLTEAVDWSSFVDLLVSAVGWWIGLLASGFPRIVSSYKPA